MRSLARKLTLAFLVVGLTGAGLVAVFVRLQTQREFDRFVLSRYERDLIDEMAQAYAAAGSWEGIDALLTSASWPRQRPGHRYESAIAVVNDQGIVVLAAGRYDAGERVAERVLNAAVPIELEGVVVGRAILGDAPPGMPVPDSPETDFLAAVGRAIALSALGATAVALLLGILLARTIAEPVRELTRATQRLARGELGQAVTVRTQDEIGQLAGSFNRMSHELAQANRLRRQMTADVAHDLRTPTSVILGYTEALSDGKLPGTSETFRVLHQEARHLDRLIEDLRTLSLADAGELALTPQRVPVAALLERAHAAYSVQAADKGVALRLQAAPLDGAVQVDPDRIAQVLGNLVSNALRYTPTGGAITLRARARGGEWILEVADTGAGIAPADLPHVFRRFYRADPARGANGESGLGLAIARSIAEAHGGRMAVESEPGQGSVFRVHLPAAGR